jgi:excisionase family DNA binding protein
MLEFKTISSLSKELNISTSWIYKQVESCLIPFHRFGNSIRFTADDVDEIIKSNEHKPLNSKLKFKQTKEVSHDG